MFYVFVRSQLSVSFPLPPPLPDILQCWAGLCIFQYWLGCVDSSDSNLVLLPCVLASSVHNCQSLVRFLLWKLSLSFHIFHRHRVCLVDLVDLICRLYSWWEGFFFRIPQKFIMIIFSFIFISWRLITLQYCSGFVIH